MNISSGLKKRINRTIESLPESALVELVTFLDYLQYRESSDNRQTTTPYTPVALGGLWQGARISDEDIDEVRRGMWTGWGQL